MGQRLHIITFKITVLTEPLINSWNCSYAKLCAYSAHYKLLNNIYIQYTTYCYFGNFILLYQESDARFDERKFH